MKIILLILHLAASLLLCSSSGAQQKTKQEAATEGTERPKFKIVSQQFSDWTYQCLVSASDNESEQKAPKPRCEISQSVQRVFEDRAVEIINMSLTQANDKAGKVKWALVVLAPLGLNIHLPSDFGLIVGKKKPFLTRFRNCSAQGCQVVIPADNSLLTSFKRANDGAARFRLLDGQVVEVKFSLAGFTKAFNALGSGSLPVQQNVQVKESSQ